jgi:hypothetical protein
LVTGDSTPATPTAELQMIQPHVTHIIQFITVVAQDSDHSDGNVAACAGLIGSVPKTSGHWPSCTLVLSKTSLMLVKLTVFCYFQSKKNFHVLEQPSTAKNCSQCAL